ncbi:hypothetical protein CBR_g8222 [Chara braunii]|uniref:Uncharacterized protein n=1 Tax=Chara braunii TaxID=69332 RepID=A0A388KLJ6_CHABU|nr:hypothetical protein CBR_g8222 [Chara braunii]|eukprot:GBG70920.1 hypothetical protein CBR_g8222 [Chara braunii]
MASGCLRRGITSRWRLAKTNGCPCYLVRGEGRGTGEVVAAESIAGERWICSTGMKEEEAAVKEEDSATTASGRTKKKNLFEVIRYLPNFGIGAEVHRSDWPPRRFYQVTNIRLNQDGRHGKAWGVLYNAGKIGRDGREEEIRGSLKRGWRYVKHFNEQEWITLE